MPGKQDMRYTRQVYDYEITYVKIILLFNCRISTLNLKVEGGCHYFNHELYVPYPVWSLYII